MPDTRLILHVKGTESDTAVLPREEVRNAVEEGKLSQSQLIWRPEEHTWKPVRELYDLLPVEHLILHVKGTESEIRQVPKPAVREAISKGEISHSQLIWRPEINTWKPVRELPELLPVEQMIMHVKGTEADTKTLPKPAIRTAISKGEITHSQLIWRPNQQAWKQVRELPELLPTQRLAPAPKAKPVVQAAMAEDGIIPESPNGPVDRAVVASEIKPQVRVATVATPQIRAGDAVAISPVVGAKDGANMTPVKVPQVRIVSADAMAATPRESQAHAQPVAKAVDARVNTDGAQGVPAVVAQERVTSIVVPVAGLPTKGGPQVQPSGATDFSQSIPAETGAPLPVVRLTASQAPAVLVAIPKGATATARVRAAAASDPASVPPKVRPGLAVNPSSQSRVSTVAPTARDGKLKDDGAQIVVEKARDRRVKEASDHSLVKWICFGLCALIAGFVGVNYYFVDRPLISGLSGTAFGKVNVYGHLGAFMQPNVIVIHIPASTEITRANFDQLLVALAQSTPNNPVTGAKFDRVALTAGWTAQYSLAGYDWKALADAGDESAEKRKADLVSELADGAGQPLAPESTLSEAAQEEKREQIWSSFLSTFAAK